jgi:dihydrofolate reductase
MGTIILSSLISLDGRINGPDGGIGWHVVGPEVHQYFNDQAREVDTFLYGRRTYEGMAEFWPTADRDPDSTPEVIEYAKLTRPKPKLVFSDTLESAGWNTEIVDGGSPCRDRCRTSSAARVQTPAIRQRRPGCHFHATRSHR